ncbi:SurA N-terminal domain-containing protein, partial [bacterium]|nr:SurA N-terminal domain-containing protein [bacterium]
EETPVVEDKKEEPTEALPEHTITAEEGPSDAGMSPKLVSQIKIVVAFLIGMGLVLGANALVNSDKTEVADEDSIATALNIEKTKVVAKVNGEKVLWDDYERSLQEIAGSITAYGGDLADPTMQEEVKNQAMDALVNTTLLLQVATDAGIEVSDEDVDGEITLLEEQFGGAEALETALEGFDLTPKELRESVKEQLTISGYIDGKLESTSEVSDEEVAERYNTVAADTDIALPTLDEVREDIRAQMASERELENVSALIEELKAEADIEILL